MILDRDIPEEAEKEINSNETLLNITSLSQNIINETIRIQKLEDMNTYLTSILTKENGEKIDKPDDANYSYVEPIGFGIIKRQLCHYYCDYIMKDVDFTNLQVGDVVLCEDEYSREIDKHAFVITSVETESENITENNERGVRYYGEDLSYRDYENRIGSIAPEFVTNLLTINEAKTYYEECLKELDDLDVER